MVETVTRNDDSPRHGEVEFALATCNGAVQFWWKQPYGGFRSYGSKLTRVSRDSSHLLYFVDAEPKQPGWEEIQTFSFLDLGGKRAIVQWTRAVNNRELEPSDPKRWFYTYGVAHLKRIDDECDDEFVTMPPARTVPAE